MSDAEYTNHKNRIGECVTFDSFNRLNLPYLYFDGQMTDKSVKVEVKVELNESVQIRTECRDHHVVLCLTDIKMTDTVHVTLITDYFQKQVDDLKAELKVDENNLETAKLRVNENGRQLQTTKDNLEELKEKMLRLKSNIEQEKQTFSSQMESKIVTFDEVISSLRKLLDDETFHLTEELGKILLESRIEVNEFKNVINLRPQIIKMTELDQMFKLRVSRSLTDVNQL